MAVAPDAVGPSSAGASSLSSLTLSWSHTIGSGADRAAYVGFAKGGSTGTLSTVTFGGANMTLVASVVVPGTSDTVYLYRLLNPTTGANTVAITYTGTAPNSIVGGSVSFTGVDQTTPDGTPVTAGVDIASAPSLAVTTTSTNSLVVDIAATGTGLSSSGQTQRWLNNASGASAVGNAAQSTAAGTGGSVTMSYTPSTADWWGMVVVEVLPTAVPQDEGSYNSHVNMFRMLGG